jgi:hypothetical protein
MDRFYLQWNIVNWITVILMASVGMLLIGAISSGIRQYQGKSPISSGATA